MFNSLCPTMAYRIHLIGLYSGQFPRQLDRQCTGVLPEQRLRDSRKPELVVDLPGQLRWLRSNTHRPHGCCGQTTAASVHSDPVLM